MKLGQGARKKVMGIKPDEGMDARKQGDNDKVNESKTM